MIYPSKKLIVTTLILACLWLVLSISKIYGNGGDSFWIVPAATSLVLVVIVIFDWLSSRAFPYIHVARNVAHTLPVGKKCSVYLRVFNPRPEDIQLQIYDHVPSALKLQSSTPDLRLKGDEEAEIRYQVLPVKRGDTEFTAVDIIAQSRFGFWLLKNTKKLKQKTKVYPNFAAISQLADLVHDKQGAQVGLRIKPKRGEGIEFHQLRDFRRGDSIRHVDWKASSRMRKLISRSYQDERDQEIIFMLDCGRRLRSQDGELSHFDHCLNATLLTAYFALSKGDKVGLMSFAGKEVWYPPQGGNSALPGLIKSTYALHSTIETSDYLGAATQLIKHQKRRALVILLSNFNAEEADDLKLAIQLLRKKNLVITASLKQAYYDNLIEREVDNFDAALEYSGVSQALLDRNKLSNELKNMGVYLVDTLPRELPIKLVNQYLAMKRAGLC